MYGVRFDNQNVLLHTNPLDIVSEQGRCVGWIAGAVAPPKK